MKKLLGVVISLVIILAIIPVIANQTETYNELTVSDNFVATEVLATPEVVTLENTPDTINRVTVNGVALTVTTEYTLSGDDVTILANNSETDDVIVVTYVYTYETDASLDVVMGVFLTIVLVGSIGWFAKSMFFK